MKKKITTPVTISNCTFTGPVRADKDSETMQILAKALHENGMAIHCLAKTFKNEAPMIHIETPKPDEEAV